jgi:hypothetical protein
MRDFWLSCGHHLLDRDQGGGLVATDDFLKVYLARPELAPPPEACAAERALHAAVLAEPRRAIAAAEIAAIADGDARENWSVMLAFRDHLLRHRTIEAAYLALVREGIGTTPALFINQLVHVILRNALDECEDTLMLRAAEMFFRTQRLTSHEGSLIAADEEMIASVGEMPASPLVAMLGLDPGPNVDILGADNRGIYWDRSDLFDTALDLTAGREGLAALARVMEIWLRHLLSIEVTIEPLTEMRDVNLAWYVGLDAEGTRIGDALWNGDDLDDADRARVVGLFRMTFADPSVTIEKVGSEPVFLILAMNGDKLMRMKPQNFVTGLPLRNREAVS